MRLIRPMALAGIKALAIWLPTSVSAGQLDITVSPLKFSGEKALVKLEMVNHLSEPVASARAACFISDDQGRVVAQSTRWVIGGGATNRAAMQMGATNVFHFVVSSPKPWATTNLTGKLIFNRVVLQSGKLADPVKEVAITATK